MRLDYLAKHYGGKLLTLIKDLGNGEGAVNVKIAGTEDTGDGALGVNVKQSEIVQPTDLQSRYSQTIQTHNAVSVGASGITTNVTVDTKGYSKAVLIHSGNPGSAQARARILMSSGTVITSELASTTSGTTGWVRIDLNGIEKISVWGADTSGATNAITIEVCLMA